MFALFISITQSPAATRSNGSILSPWYKLIPSLPTLRQLLKTHPERLLLLAPLIFAAHVLEEAPGIVSPGYVPWFNSIVARPLPQTGFLRDNIQPFAIIALISLLAAVVKRRWAMYIMLAWLSFYMFANAIFHVVATLVIWRYAPGAVTAVVLYLPYFWWFVSDLRTRFRAGPDIILLITALAGLPMFLQGYMIVFKHSRFY